MNLNEAIEHCKEIASSCGDNEKECSSEHLQLMQWLQELQEIKQAEKNSTIPAGRALRLRREAYKQGFEKAIDKACKWWENELTYPSMTSEEIKWYKDKINAFRKAMKDE